MRCWVKSRNERNPYRPLLTGKAEDSDETAGDNSEEGGDDVKSSCPLRPGLHTCYNGYNKETRDRKVEQNSEKYSQFRLWAATRHMKLELLVIADQHAAVNTFPGLVHTARHTMRAGDRKSTRLNSSHDRQSRMPSSA